MLQEIKKDLKELLQLIQKEGRISSTLISELAIDKMSLKELFIVLEALVLTLRDYAEIIELNYDIEANDDFFESLRKRDYLKQEIEKILGLMKNINAILDKCFLYADKVGLQ